MFGMSARDKQEMEAIRRTAESADARITNHEAVCAERQGEIRKQLDSLQRVVWGVMLGTMTGAVGVVLQLLMHFITLK